MRVRIPSSVYLTSLFLIFVATAFCFGHDSKNNNDKKMQRSERKKKVLLGIEPGFRDSEAPVITVTLQDPTMAPAAPTSNSLAQNRA